MKSPILLLVIGLLLTACALEDIEDLVTIEQGVYGQCSVEDDVGPARYPCGSGKIFAVFLEEPGERGTEVPLEASVAVTNSNRDGFYQIALDEGEYGLCHIVDNGNEPFVIACTEVTVRESRTSRYDYTFGFLSEFIPR